MAEPVIGELYRWIAEPVIGGQYIVRVIQHIKGSGKYACKILIEERRGNMFSRRETVYLLPHDWYPGHRYGVKSLTDQEKEAACLVEAQLLLQESGNGLD